MKLTCEKLIFGGLGMARTEDRGVVFIEGLLPGEEGEVKEVGKKGSIPLFATKKILTTSPHRRKPACEYFGTCGGCNWLHYAYDEQVATKKRIFMDSLERIGHLKDIPEPEVFTGSELGYRRRAQLHLVPQAKQAGFFKRASKEVIDIHHCPLLSDNLNDILSDKKRLFAQLPNIKNIKLLDLGETTLSSPVIRDVTRQYGTITVGEYTFNLEGNSFFQSNQFLVETMATWCEGELTGKHLLDLFGGVGLFAVIHGKHFKDVTLVEHDKVMADKALHSMKANGLPQGKTYGMPAERFFQKAVAGTYDAIIVDPPRTGMSKEVRQGIATTSPKQILSISCDPTTQARDLDYLVNTAGYKIVKTALFDLYPNTDHIESGVLLSK